MGATDFSMSLQGAWTSPHTGITCPNQFGLSVPSRGMNLTLTPELADQDLSAWQARLAGILAHIRDAREWTGAPGPLTPNNEGDNHDRGHWSKWRSY